MTRLAMLILWLALWVVAAFPASLTGGRLLNGREVLSDTSVALAVLALLAIALVCRWENGTWISSAMAMIPVFGLVHSLGCFWRLPAHHAHATERLEAGS